MYNSLFNRMFGGLIRKSKNSQESLKKMEISLKINIFVVYKKSYCTVVNFFSGLLSTSL